MCQTCDKDLFCPKHLAIDSIKDVEGLWNVVRYYLNRIPTAQVRNRERDLLVRRLKHPEAGASVEYGQKLLDTPAVGPRPHFKPPLCECGKDLYQHDTMSGECDDTGCEMFTEVT